MRNTETMNQELAEIPVSPQGATFGFGTAIHYLKQGNMLQRQGWNGKGIFVFMQVPADIDLDIVPNMQSLPQQVKLEFMNRLVNGVNTFTDVDPIEFNDINYRDQLATVYPNNYIYGWSPSPSDVLADDWQLYEPTTV